MLCKNLIAIDNEQFLTVLIVITSILTFFSQLLYEESLRRLREEVVRANVLVREANQLSSEMKTDTDFAVTLQVC